MPHSLDRYRALFPVCEQYAYLNNAAVSPPSLLAARAAAAWFDDAVRHGVVHGDAWNQRTEEVRGLSARLLGASPGEIAFVRSTSHGLGLVAEGLDWKPGDEVAVCAELEYPSNVYVWQHLHSKGVVVRPIEPVRGGVTVEAAARAIGPRTRLLSASSVQYATGHRTDLGALGKLCRERGVLFCVDGIQSVGASAIDVHRDHIDFLAADSHKWLLGINGIGFLYVGEAVIDRLRPVLVGWKSTADAWNFDRATFELRRDAAKLEEGSLAYTNLYAMGAAIELLLEVGLPAIEDRIAGLLERLERRLVAAGCDVSPGADERAGILTFAPAAGRDPAVLAEKLAGASVCVSLRRARVRVSPHFYNNEQDIDALAEVVERNL
jgi:cysteine desulfurase / selenocysteine lyase